MPDPIPPTQPVEPPKAPEPKTDPFVSNLAKTLGMTVSEEPKIEPVQLDQPVTANRTLAEIVVANQDKAKETPPPPPASPAPPATPPAEPPKVEPPKEKVEVKRPEAEALRQKLEELKSQPPATAPSLPAPPAAPPAAPDDDYVKSLTDEQKDDLELAKYAETKGQSGVSQKLVGFYKDFDAWVIANPEASSADIDEYTRTHRPVIQNRRKLEREWVADTTKNTLEKQLSERTQELERRQHALEIKPKIESIVRSFSDLLTDPKQLSLPADVTGIDREVVECIQKEGYQAAVQKYPIEAPIAQQTIGAVESYLKMVNGVEPYRPQYDGRGNPVNMQAWIAQFIARQENLMMQAPEEKQLNSAKQRFLPADKYTKLLQEKPEEASKYYTFSDDWIIDLLAVNANISASAKLKELEAAGFKRERPSKTANPPPPPTPPKVDTTPPTPAPPKAGTSAIPNHSASAPQVNPNASFLDKLVPGASARI
jgi:hypothetical protein